MSVDGVTVGGAAPHNLIRWPATSLTTTWAAYRVYRRRSGAKAGEWTRIAEITAAADVGADMSATNAEKYRTEFRDYETACSPAEYDYYVSVVSTDESESVAANIEPRQTLAGGDRWWLVSNTDPELNVACDVVTDYGGSWDNRVKTFQAAGRDGQLVSAATERPGRKLGLTCEPYGSVAGVNMAGGEGLAEGLRAALQHGAPPYWCLKSPMGDIHYGWAQLAGLDLAEGGFQAKVSVDFWTDVEPDSQACDWQGPARMYLDGSTGLINFGVQSALDVAPDTSLSVLQLQEATDRGATFEGFAGNRKASAGGIMMLCSGARQLRVWVEGATTDTFLTGSTAIYDSNRHVVGLRKDGDISTLSGWVDGVNDTGDQSDTSDPGGSTATWNIGARGGGDIKSQVFVVATVIWRRALSDDEMAQATWALKGYPGWQLPPFAELYVDMRDPDCYVGSGQVKDLSGNGRDGTVSGTTVWIPRGP